MKSHTSATEQWSWAVSSSVPANGRWSKSSFRQVSLGPTRDGFLQHFPLRCHQTWLVNHRTEWSLMDGKFMEDCPLPCLFARVETMSIHSWCISPPVLFASFYPHLLLATSTFLVTIFLISLICTQFLPRKSLCFARSIHTFGWLIYFLMGQIIFLDWLKQFLDWLDPVVWLALKPYFSWWFNPFFWWFNHVKTTFLAVFLEVFPVLLWTQVKFQGLPWQQLQAAGVTLELDEAPLAMGKLGENWEFLPMTLIYGKLMETCNFHDDDDDDEPSISISFFWVDYFQSPFRPCFHSYLVGIFRVGWIFVDLLPYSDIVLGSWTTLAQSTNHFHSTRNMEAKKQWTSNS